MTVTSTAYPDYNTPFHIYTDASNCQLGAVAIESGRPVANYSGKLNKAQLNHTNHGTRNIIDSRNLKEHCSILSGSEIYDHTDPKHLTLENLKTQYVLCWRTYIEEYSPMFNYSIGPQNKIVNTFSGLHC